MTTERKRLLTLIALPLLGLIVFFVLPVGMMILFSFKETTFGALFPPTLQHYIDFFGTREYFALLLDSTWVALLVAALSILLAYPVAYFLSFHGSQHRYTLLAILILPSWTSYLLRILAWKVMLGSNGIINSLLLSLGWIETGSPIFLYSKAAVLITLVYVWMPFAVLPIFTTLERMDTRLLEASQDLGATPLATFLRITLPLSLPGVIAAFFFVFIPTLGEWVTPALVGGVDGIMYGNLIQDQFLRGLNWPLGTVLSLALFALVSVFTVLLMRFITVEEITSVA